MSKIPNFIDNRTLRSLAAPDETTMVRVLARRVSSSVAFRHRARLRTYAFEKNGTLAAHVLDVPASVWMQGIPNGAYRENPSISDDLQPTALVPLTIQVLPWPGATVPASTEPPAEPPAETPRQAAARKAREAKQAKKAARDKALV